MTSGDDFFNRSLGGAGEYGGSDVEGAGVMDPFEPLSITANSSKSVMIVQETIDHYPQMLMV